MGIQVQTGKVIKAGITAAETNTAPIPANQKTSTRTSWTFVVLQVKNFLLEMDYTETAEKYYKEISSASRDCKVERAELAEVEKRLPMA